MSKTTKILPPMPHTPIGLSDRALTLWNAVVPVKARSAGRLALIEEALRALDRADDARLVVEVEGMTSTTASTGAVHVHPLVKVERENRQAFARMWVELGFDFDRDMDEPGERWYAL